MVCFHDVMLYVVVMMMMMVMNVEWGVWIVDCRLWSVDRRWKKMEVRRWGGVYVCKV